MERVAKVYSAIMIYSKELNFPCKIVKLGFDNTKFLPKLFFVFDQLSLLCYQIVLQFHSKVYKLLIGDFSNCFLVRLLLVITFILLEMNNSPCRKTSESIASTRAWR